MLSDFPVLGPADAGLDWFDVLDMDGSLFDGQGVNYDLEVNAPFTPPFTTNGVG